MHKGIQVSPIEGGWNMKRHTLSRDMAAAGWPSFSRVVKTACIVAEETLPCA
jgi:hypothetical protein